MSAPSLATTEKRRRLPPEERRAQLLEIAIDVFADRGLGAARHAEIAERAGVAVSTAFVYFPTREALVDAVLDEVATFFLEAAERLHGQEKGCVEILRDVDKAFLDFVQTHPSQAIVWLEWGAAVREDVWPRYRAFTEAVVVITRRTLERGQREGCVPADADVESLARLFASSSQSIARLQLGGVDTRTVQRFQDTVLRAIVSEEALA
ncbi:MAG: TetR/AcrR family transcriptional regulator [Deltaproteobacteria bacterium]|nr:TetR/AcrR family transcriptional regulator [Deltaproteobacteria bacterium]